MEGLVSARQAHRLPLAEPPGPGSWSQDSDRFRLGVDEEAPSPGRALLGVAAELLDVGEGLLQSQGEFGATFTESGN